jgi:hypothetical protein
MHNNEMNSSPSLDHDAAQLKALGYDSHFERTMT